MALRKDFVDLMDLQRLVMKTSQFYGPQYLVE